MRCVGGWELVGSANVYIRITCEIVERCLSPYIQIERAKVANVSCIISNNVERTKLRFSFGIEMFVQSICIYTLKSTLSDGFVKYIDDRRQLHTDDI